MSRLAESWRDFRESYAGLTRAQMMLPGVVGNWSVRDLIAHVTTWEQEALRHLPLILRGGRPPRYSAAYGGIDAFNALMTERKAKLPLSKVLREQQRVHDELIALIEAAPDGELRGETRFRRRLRLDTYGHYAIHAAAIRRWRAPQRL